MRKHIFKLIALFIGIFIICQGIDFDQVKTMVLQPKYSNSFSYEGPYTYMGSNGTTKTTVANGAESHQMYELLGAIEAKYGTAAAQTYLACAQAGDYTAYYNMVGNSQPTFYEQFKYSTNGNTMQVFGPMSVESHLYQAGVSSVAQLLQNMTSAGYSNLTEYLMTIKTGAISKPTSNTPNTQAANVQPESATSESTTKEQTNETTTKETEKKEISHGVFDDISDEAEKAFAELLSDGVDESCYVQIKADAEDRTISAETVSKTLSQKEDGRVDFYNKGENEDYSEFSYSVTFPQIEVESDVDLAATYALLDTSKYENVYQLAFVTEQNISSNIIVTLNVSGNSGDKYYLLRGNDDSDYNTFATAEADENGYIAFETNQLDNIIVITTDIVSMRQAEEEAALKIEEEAKQAEEASVEASTQASAEAEVEIESSEETQDDNEQEKSNMLFILIGIGCLVVLGAGTRVLVYKKRH